MKTRAEYEAKLQAAYDELGIGNEPESLSTDSLIQIAAAFKDIVEKRTGMQLVFRRRRYSK